MGDGTAIKPFPLCRPPLPAAWSLISAFALVPYNGGYDDACDKHNENNNRDIFHDASRPGNIGTDNKNTARRAILPLFAAFLI
jgi:hypothetical protein